MKGNSKIKKDTEEENKFGQMAQCMRVIFWMMLPMAEED